MISEIVTAGFLLAAAAQDYRWGKVYDLTWIIGIIAAGIIGAWEYNAVAPPFAFAAWFAATGMMVYWMTKFGLADVGAFALIGTGATTRPWTALALIATTATIYSMVWVRVRDDQIRLIPAFALAYLATMFTLFL